MTEPVTKTTIPHKACGTPGECRKEQVCLDGWRCAAEASVTRTTDRAAAVRDGRARYFSGRACRNGHLADRYTSSGQCVVCAGQVSNRWHKRLGTVRRQVVRMEPPHAD